MARLLIVGGGCRGRTLAAELAAAGHAVRITTRGEGGRAAIERAGAECVIADPDVVGTLRPALENVTLLCWLLGTARGADDALAALHGSRLEMMLTNTIDTTVRGVLYEAAGSVPSALLAAGADAVRRVAGRSQIPVALLHVDPAHGELWRTEAAEAIARLLGERHAGTGGAVE